MKGGVVLNRVHQVRILQRHALCIKFPFQDRGLKRRHAKRALCKGVPCLATWPLPTKITAFDTLPREMHLTVVSA